MGWKSFLLLTFNIFWAALSGILVTQILLTGMSFLSKAKKENSSVL